MTATVIASAGSALGLEAPVLSDYTLADFDGPGSSVALVSTGDLSHTGTGSDVPNAAEWLSRQFAGAGGAYEARLTVVSGDAPTGGDAVGSWINLLAGAAWGLVLPGPGSLAGVWDIEIGFAGLQSALTTGRYTVSADQT